MADDGAEHKPVPNRFEQLENKEHELWRLSLWLLGLMAVGWAASSWEMLRTLPHRLEGLPIGVVVLMVLFAVYVWNKRKEISELRSLVRAMQERSESLPDSRQLEQLFGIVSQSQKGYRDLIDSFEDIVFSINLEGVVRTSNKRGAEMLGEKMADLINQPLDQFLAEPARAAALKLLPRFLEQRHWTGPIRVRIRKTGEMRHFELALRAIVKSDTVMGISGLARDVTYERESETRFTEFFQTLQEGIFTRTPDGSLIDVNPAMVHMLGYEAKEDLLAVNWHKLDPAATEKNAKEGGEVTLTRKDASHVVCLMTSTPIYNPSGDVVRYQGTLIDITERREMEKLLFQEQEFARRLVDSFPDTIVALDREARYTFLSSRTEELLGYRPDELMGQTMGTNIAPDDLPEVQAAYHDLISGKTAFATLEYRLRHRNGHLLVVRTNASPLLDAEGRISGVVASTRDLTEFKHLEQQVIQSEKMAAMGRMIGGVAHELNNPLTVILGASDISRSRATDPAAARHFDIIHQQAKRTADIVQNLLAFSRPRASGAALMDLNEVVRRALQLHEYPLRVNNIKADFVPTPGLPLVAGDSNQLVQVFLNLVTNAEQAIHEVRDSGSIKIRLGQKGGRVQATVQDNGPGISPEQAPYIFDPFYTTKRPGRGTGLGLSICVSILREHGATIETQPAPGEGALFTLSFPAGIALAPPAPAPAVNLQGRSVLVVDDEPCILDLVKMQLASQGLNVDCQLSGEAALANSAGRTYDLIICDLKMPGLDGREVFEQFSGRQPDRPPRFILMTGDLLDSGAQEFLKKTRAPLLQKPFTLADLNSVMYEALAT